MNAALISKSAKGLVVASGLALATSVPGFAAQDAAVNLGALANQPLNMMYVNPPAGAVTLGGKSFSVTGFDWLDHGQSGTFAAAFTNVSGVYVLVNSSYTAGAYAGLKVGTVQLTYGDGTSSSVDLVEGSNVREWNIGASWTVHTVTDPNSSQVWTGTAGDNSAAAIDMLTITPTSGKNLASVTVSNTDTSGMGVHLQVNGLSVAYSLPAPTPTPTPTVDPTPKPKHTGDADRDAHHSTAKDPKPSKGHAKHHGDHDGQGHPRHTDD